MKLDKQDMTSYLDILELGENIRAANMRRALVGCVAIGSVVTWLWCVISK